MKTYALLLTTATTLGLSACGAGDARTARLNGHIEIASPSTANKDLSATAYTAAQYVIDNKFNIFVASYYASAMADVQQRGVACAHGGTKDILWIDHNDDNVLNSGDSVEASLQNCDDSGLGPVSGTLSIVDLIMGQRRESGDIIADLQASGNQETYHGIYSFSDDGSEEICTYDGDISTRYAGGDREKITGAVITSTVSNGNRSFDFGFTLEVGQANNLARYFVNTTSPFTAPGGNNPQFGEMTIDGAAGASIVMRPDANRNTISLVYDNGRASAHDSDIWTNY